MALWDFPWCGIMIWSILYIRHEAVKLVIFPSWDVVERICHFSFPKYFLLRCHLGPTKTYLKPLKPRVPEMSRVVTVYVLGKKTKHWITSGKNPNTNNRREASSSKGAVWTLRDGVSAALIIHLAPLGRSRNISIYIYISPMTNISGHFWTNGFPGIQSHICVVREPNSFSKNGWFEDTPSFPFGTWRTPCKCYSSYSFKGRWKTLCWR